MPDTVPLGCDSDQTRIAAPLSGLDSSPDVTRVAASEPAQAVDSEATRVAPTAAAPSAPVRSAAEPAEGFEVGHRIARPDAKDEYLYEILAVHRGGMGIVYCAYSFDISAPVALKTLRNRFAEDPKARQLFIEEGRTWVRLGKHPYIARAGNVRTIDGMPYVVTDWIQGPDGMSNDLRGWLGHARLTLPVAVEMALQIAQGMQHAAAKVPGLVHRDLKPANILVDRYARVKVTDFGLAATDDAHAGTPAYMAPEQWLGRAADSRTDIYAYGCIVYEMLTGRRLFAAATADEWRAAHLLRSPTPPRTLKPEIPAGLEEFVLRSMAKEPEQRPDSWNEVVSEMAVWFHRLTGQPAVVDFSGLEPTADDLYQDGWCFFELGAYEDALGAYERILELRPESSTAWTNKAVALTRLKRDEEALAAADSALRINPRYTDAWRLKARLLRSSSRSDEAVAVYDRLLELEPKNASLWKDKGELLWLSSRYEEAAAAYARAIEINPDTATWSRRVHCLSMAKRYSEALEFCDRGLLRAPRSAELLLERAKCLDWLKRYEEALDACDRVLAINPRSEWALLERGKLLKSLNRPEDALAAYRRAAEIDPDFRHAVEYAGKILLELGRFDEALATFDRLIAAEPEGIGLWGLKGKALAGLERHAEAIAAFDRALQVFPRDLPALIAKGKMLRDIGRTDDAIQAYAHANEVRPLPPICKWQGELLCKQGRYVEALAVYDRMIELFPKIPAWAEKRAVLMQLRRYQEALEVSDRETERYPESAAAWEGRGAVLAALHRYSDAATAYEAALKLAPESAEARSGYEAALRSIDAARQPAPAAVIPPAANHPTSPERDGSSRNTRGWFKRLLGRTD